MIDADRISFRVKSASSEKSQNFSALSGTVRPYLLVC